MVSKCKRPCWDVVNKITSIQMEASHEISTLTRKHRPNFQPLIPRISGSFGQLSLHYKIIMPTDYFSLEDILSTETVTAMRSQ